MAKEEIKKNTETPKVDEVPEMSDAESNEMMNKILNAFKEAATEVPQVEVSKEAEYIDKIARLQAEFDNSRKRMDKEKQEILLNANANLLTEILPTLDHFELALKHNKDPGVQMIYDELKETLAKYGLKVVNAKGTFNPNIHEAVVRVEGEKENVIVEEIQKGYFINERLLRASKVKVSRLKDTK
ncbi:MAG: nucleotide exchange factor GrpE [archaeon]